MESTSRPLQPLNGGLINARGGLATPVKPAVQPAKPARKKKEKLLSLCKTPPLIVRTRNGRDFQRGLFLGEGGFARCFQMKDLAGQVYAAKTVAKALIKNEKTKTKLLLEIKIHKLLKNPNIVNFVDCFEDDVNVYILLEICPNQLLMEMLKTRKLVLEPEVRLFMVQIIGAIKYLHLRRVIHRDLKLGNIFFDPDMNLKVGDFGLAAVLPLREGRKYTICGTPNYIAPEVLGGKQTGHLYEVDTWAIGVMMFALLFGKPPFQLRDVQVIYERIKRIEYAFPADLTVLAEARQLVRDLLSLNPLDRPLLDDILEYPWFRLGPFPSAIGVECLEMTPLFHHLLAEELLANFNTAKAKAGVYYAVNKTPVEILKTDLELERPRALLPQLLSPGDTKYKYMEVDPALLARPRRLLHEYLCTTQQLDQSCFETYQTMRRLDRLRHDPLAVMEIPSSCEQPIIVSKWVDYSNKYGFLYQLSTNDIGVLFNDDNTYLRLHNTGTFLEILFSPGEGWMSMEHLVLHPPLELRRNLEIVEFFAKYMNSNLSKVTDGEQRVGTVLLRRYARTDDYIMFELTNGSFQFNFKDHHKLVLSQTGLVITHISPSRAIVSRPLADVLTHGNFATEPVPECMNKVMVMKDAIKRRAFRE